MTHPIKTAAPNALTFDLLISTSSIQSSSWYRYDNDDAAALPPAQALERRAVHTREEAHSASAVAHSAPEEVRNAWVAAHDTQQGHSNAAAAGRRRARAANQRARHVHDDGDGVRASSL